jgi:hypothetical protein
VLSIPAAYSSQECSACQHTHPDNCKEKRFVCQRCGHEAHADTHAGKFNAARGIQSEREQTVVVLVVKGVVYKKRKPKNGSGRESSSMPVEARTSREALAKSIQQKINQAYWVAKQDASTTAPTGI